MKRKSRLRYELLREFTIVAVVPLLITSVVAVNYFIKSFVQRAESKINSDLESAIYVYGKIKDDLKYVVRDQNRAIFTLYKRGEIHQLRKYLEKVVWRNNLSFFTVTNNYGKVILCVNNPKTEGSDLSANPLIQRALKDETIVTTEIVSEEELKREGLSEKAEIDLVETKGAKPITKKVETRGLVLKVVMPVKDEVHRIVGVMSGGYLLNRNYSIIDLISEKVGTKTTIFLDDTRIATNILNLDGSRALGTMVSEKVGREVLELGKTYLGRTWAVNAWYITAYEPIRDSNNKIIGALYVGEPEAPFIALRNRIIRGFILSLGFAMLIGVAFAFFNARRVTKPIEQLRQGAEVIGTGNLEHRILLKAKNEIGELADAFNKMTEDLKKVREELVSKERLATLGEMSAAVVHELKNSLTGIKVTSFYLSRKIGQDRPELLQNLKTIEAEAERGSRTVTNILYFSHPVKPVLKPTNVNALINEVILLVQGLGLLGNIEVSKNLNLTLPTLMLDPERFRQVILNLILNSSEAISKGGKITITTRMITPTAFLLHPPCFLCENKEGGEQQEGGANIHESKFVEIQVEDTGYGISEGNLSKIFDPFFTTKSGGIGLGLTVVRNIVEEHQGKIEVESKENQGTTFVIKLPLSRENQEVAGKNSVIKKVS